MEGRKHSNRSLSLMMILLMMGTLWFGLMPQRAYAVDVAIDATNFPDANFRAHVEDYDLDSDGVLSQAEADAVTSMDVQGESIADLTGIEYFTQLRELECGDNELTALDLSGNPQLAILYCYLNELTALDLSGNPQLAYFYCAANQLTALDVSDNLQLIDLSCGENMLTELDVSSNSQLQYLECVDNKLTELDVSNNPWLMELNCSRNLLTHLDLSNNDRLWDLYCYGQQGPPAIALDDGQHYVIDMAQAFPAIDVTKVESIDNRPGYTYDLETHRIIIDKSEGTAGSQVYYYDVEDPWPISNVIDVSFDWTLRYQVDFQVNGGSPVDLQLVAPDGILVEPVAPVKEGFTFSGWYTDTALTNAFDFNTEINKNWTLYAKWTAVEKDKEDAPGTVKKATSPNTGDTTPWMVVFWAMVASTLLMLLTNGRKVFPGKKENRIIR